jgi:hypothetical protein
MTTREKPPGDAEPGRTRASSRLLRLGAEVLRLGDPAFNPAGQADRLAQLLGADLGLTRRSAE